MLEFPNPLLILYNAISVLVARGIRKLKAPGARPLQAPRAPIHDQCCCGYVCTGVRIRTSSTGGRSEELVRDLTNASLAFIYADDSAQLTIAVV